MSVPAFGLVQFSAPQPPPRHTHPSTGLCFNGALRQSGFVSTGAGRDVGEGHRRSPPRQGACAACGASLQCPSRRGRRLTPCAGTTGTPADARAHSLFSPCLTSVRAQRAASIEGLARMRQQRAREQDTAAGERAWREWNLEIEALRSVHGVGGPDAERSTACFEHRDSVHRRRASFLHLLLRHLLHLPPRQRHGCGVTLLILARDLSRRMCGATRAIFHMRCSTSSVVHVWHEAKCAAARVHVMPLGERIASGTVSGKQSEQRLWSSTR